MEVKEEYVIVCRCILCRRKYDEATEFRHIKETTVHTSKKSVKDVLTHLSKCIKSNVIIQEDSFVCEPCYEKLLEYDQIMLQLLVHQKELMQMLESSVNALDSEEDEDFKTEIVSDYSMENQSDADNDGSENNTQQHFDMFPIKRYKCSVCDKRLSSKSVLRVHLESHAKAKKCPICGVLRRDDEYLELHMNTHEGKSENECRYCPKRYSRRSNVIRHMHLHWDKKKFQCEKCGLRFSQANLLYNHKMHHDAEESPLVCSQCDQTFKSKKTFNHHMLTHKEDRPMYPCEVCGKKFTERYTLKVHLKTHKDPKEVEAESKSDAGAKKKPDFPCIICHRIMSTRDMLDTHMSEEHDVIGSVNVFT